jgi:ArsR family transcriptional regulator
MPASHAAADLKVRPLSRMMKALGDETRLRIVALISHGELCVCHVEGALGLTQPTASRHLSVLRAAGVVDHRRKGTWVHYQLAEQLDPDCRKVLRALVGSFAKHDLLRRDVERLLKTRGPGACR